MRGGAPESFLIRLVKTGVPERYEPQTPAYALTDWPVGRLAWMTGKFQLLTDNNGDSICRRRRRSLGNDAICILIPWYGNSALAWRAEPREDDRQPYLCGGQCHRLQRPGLVDSNRARIPKVAGSSLPSMTGLSGSSCAEIKVFLQATETRRGQGQERSLAQSFRSKRKPLDSIPISRYIGYRPVGVLMTPTETRLESRHESEPRYLNVAVHVIRSKRLLRHAHRGHLRSCRTHQGAAFSITSTARKRWPSAEGGRGEF